MELLNINLLANNPKGKFLTINIYQGGSYPQQGRKYLNPLIIEALEENGLQSAMMELIRGDWIVSAHYVNLQDCLSWQKQQDSLQKLA